MILGIARSSAAKRIFRSLLKESDVLRRNNFSLSPRCCLVFEKKNHSFEHSKISPAATPHYLYLSKCLNTTEASQGELSKVTFESICSETLESLTEYFEELVESIPEFKNADVVYSDGVLTVHLGKNFGTYVINRQSPNLQIWLSSPKSGPKRYDFICGTWVYKHDKTTLHALLDKEIKEIANQEVQFIRHCVHAKASV